MNLARIILIVVALSIAVGTAFLVKNYLQGREAEFAADSKRPIIESAHSVKVLVADSDLAAGTIISDKFLRWQTWPDDGLSPEYIVKDKEVASDKPADLSGWAVRRGIAIGEPITKNRLVEPGTAGFLAGALGPGMRAASINVNAETSAAGFILPGDRVDVMLTQQVQQTSREIEGNRNRIISETIISDVRVLAIDQKLNDMDEEVQVGKTITLELTPKQAEGLAVAKEMGGISLSLRSLLRDSNNKKKSAFTSDEDVSHYLRGNNSAPAQVLVAKHKLAAGALLNEADFTWKRLDAGESGKGKISKALTKIATLSGSYLKANVEANSFIFQDNIIRPTEHGFIVAALQPGMRAISMAVNQVSSVAGYIAPGDRVDLLLTHKIDDTSDKPKFTPRRYSETILENLRLLAIEQTIDPTTNKPRSGETVTLEVTPDQAEVVTLAATMGQLSLSLRSFPSGERNKADSAEKISTASDLGVSPAISDFLILGTSGDPNLLRRRVQLRKFLNVNKNTKLTSQAIESPTKSVIIYRATTPSTVIVKR